MSESSKSRKETPYKVDTGPIPLDTLAVFGEQECWYRIPSWRVHFDCEALKGVDIRLHRAIGSHGVWTLTEASTGLKVFADMQHEFYVGDEGAMLAEFAAGRMLQLTPEKIAEAIVNGMETLSKHTPNPFTRSEIGKDNGPAAACEQHQGSEGGRRPSDASGVVPNANAGSIPAGSASQGDKPDTPNVDAFVQRFGAWGENDLRQAAKDWNDLLAFARQLERELAKAHKAQDTFKAAAVAACAQSAVLRMDRQAIVECVESYFSRVRKLGGDTGECSAEGVADWLLWQAGNGNADALLPSHVAPIEAIKFILENGLDDHWQACDPEAKAVREVRAWLAATESTMNTPEDPKRG